MANEKSVIVKSVSLERTAEFEEFVACQKNFRRSMRVLIQQAIFQRGGKIVDIWEEYEKNVQNIVFRNQMNFIPPAEEKSGQSEKTAAVTAAPVEPQNEASGNVRGNTVETSKQSNDDTGIPEGYQQGETEWQVAVNVACHLFVHADSILPACFVRDIGKKEDNA